MRRSSNHIDTRRLAAFVPRNFDSRRLAAFIPRNFGFGRTPSRRYGPLGWLALGAGLATLGLTLFDPSRGAARRAMLRDKTSSSLRRLRDGAQDRLSDARSRASGALHASASHASHQA
jgi:hypothetical protein